MKKNEKGNCEYNGCGRVNVTLYDVRIVKWFAPSENKKCCYDCAMHYNLSTKNCF